LPAGRRTPRAARRAAAAPFPNPSAKATAAKAAAGPAAASAAIIAWPVIIIGQGRDGAKTRHPEACEPKACQGDQQAENQSGTPRPPAHGRDSSRPLSLPARARSGQSGEWWVQRHVCSAHSMAHGA
jgi:hypothetical protein